MEQSLIEIKGIDSMTIEDANQIEGLVEKYKAEYKWENKLNQLENTKIKILLALQDNIAVGFSVGIFNEVSSQGSLEALYLEPDYRNKGTEEFLTNIIKEWVESK